MADAPDPETTHAFALNARPRSSMRELAALVRRRRWFFSITVGGLLLLCLLYCLIAPNQYEAASTVALRMQTSSPLSVESAESIAPASILSTPLQLETLVNVLRSERLTWRVITTLHLYESPAFTRNFASRFPGFRADKPGAEAQSYLIERFGKRLHVRALPRTLLIEVRFRSKDPAQAAAVTNAVVRGYMEMEVEARTDTTQQASAWLERQLVSLLAQADNDQQHLAAFQREHGLLGAQGTLPDGQPIESLHDQTLQQVDEVGRQLAAATGDRILREALYREAQKGDPEEVLAENPEAAPAGTGEANSASASTLRQLASQKSTVAEELAQLSAEHGPNFPRVVELRQILADIDRQIHVEDDQLLEGFHRGCQAAAEREKMLRRQLEALTAVGLRQNDATMQYAVLRAKANQGRELTNRLQQKIQEAKLAAGVRASTIVVVDPAREPFRAVAPDTPLYLGITLVASLWLALGGALLLDIVRPPLITVRSVAICLVILGMSAGSLRPRLFAQAPTPNTSGLPSGVTTLPQDPPVSHAPNPREAPPIWNANAPAGTVQPTAPDAVPHPPGLSMALPLGAGDFVDITESHTPEFRSQVRVAADGSVTLPMIGPIRLAGMSEPDAAHAIELALVDKGMLLHPQVTVLITVAAGQDVSVLGEVTRPGVYPYTLHHRLLDLISAASGLSPNAGRLVTVFHRDDPHAGHPVVLDPVNDPVNDPGNDPGKPGHAAADDHNPEVAPGDTIVVSRAGLVYVIGDVVRPGGFAVDPAQGLTVVQALSLAWGSTPNAAVGKAILIRNQAGGRTLTTLNLRRMIRGQDPDQPVRDRDILFIPDSETKSLLNKSLESAIQSAIGVTIYAGLVYSQRF